MTATASVASAVAQAVGRSGAAEPQKPAASFSPNDRSSDGSYRVREIMADYDLDAISPREVDELADRLHASGACDFKDLMKLWTMGERFHSYLQDAMSEHPGADIAFDGTRKCNLRAIADAQLNFARRSGDPTEAWEEFISFIDELQDAGRAAPDGTLGASSAQRGRLVEAAIQNSAGTA
ncbi:hypothetical protein [Tropicimonas sp. IMCC6043]|uniref:hypothetical protein n=1 Tax=Tropicimonas sp. IMCC6043 TaxID=2510645 RepID=UPI00101BC036|nr:hypothetical protein [Tropicimonas sp. IMCC6043]RYH08192.1 hypothetical protein EU800_17140 [Tropicimonas sp. IMCC6043]